MDMDTKDLAQERLRHPSEKTRSGGPESARSGKLVLTLSILALVLALGLTYFLVQLNQQQQEMETELVSMLDDLSDDLSDLEDLLEEQGNLDEILVSDLETVQGRVGVTESGLKQARTLAETLKQEQEKSVELLSTELSSKADVDRVATLDTETGQKFAQVDQQITGVQDGLEASRKDLEKTWNELSAVGLRVTEQGQLIATNGDAVDELRRRGERDYIEFDVRRRQKITVANIVVELRKADTKRQRADLRLHYDDKRVDRKKLYTNTPILFYVGSERVQYELVINEVTKNQIAGYISIPLGSQPTSGLRRASN